MTHNEKRVSEARSLITQKIPRYIAYAGIAVLVIAGYQGCNDWRIARKEMQAKQEQIAAEARAVAQEMLATAERLRLSTPTAKGSTPCTLDVGWDIAIKTDGRPVLVKFHKKTKWLRLSGRENDPITLDQFAPGEAQFASTDDTPVQVQLFPAK